MTRSGDRRRTALRVLRMVFLALFAAALAWGVALYAGQVRAQAQAEELAALHESVGGEGLAELNPDYAGWLTVYGPGLELPAVQSGDDFYADHDFYGQRSDTGCVYVDSLVDLESGGNMLLHSRFSANSAAMRALTDYLDVDFFTEHGVLCWEYHGQEIYYELFALLAAPEDDDLALTQYVNRIGIEATESALNELAARALYWRDIPLDGTDRFLFLELSGYPDGGEYVALCARRLGT